MAHPEDYYKHKIITIPNVLSFFRLCLIPPIICQYVFCRNNTAALTLLVLSGLTDVVDGIIARKLNMISDFGKAFDPVADKLTQIAILYCLVTHFPNMLLLLIVLIAKELFTGTTSLLLVRKGMVIGADWHGKAATVLLYATMILHMAWYDIPAAASNIFIGSCLMLIVLSAVLYGIRNIGYLLKMKKTKANV